MLEPLLGNSIFTTNGDVWARQRRLVDAGFGQARLRIVFPYMISAIDEMLDRLNKVDKSLPYEVDAEMTHITADIIFRTILSENLSESSARGIFDAFNEFQVHAQRAMMLSIYSLPTFFAKRASKKAANKIRPVIATVIANRYKEKANNSLKKYNDILEGVMDAVDPVTKDSFTYEETLDQICMLFLAGHETSASALTWSLYLISNCKDLQEKMLQEITETAQNRPFQFDDIKKLNIVTNVFKEALRLYPPVGIFSREATEDHCIRNKDVVTGSAVMVSPWLVHRHTDYWENPDVFDPERFETESGIASSKCAYLPFSKGPRVCIGQTFAMQEAILVLASIVRSYELDKVESHIPRPVGRVTIRPDNGVKVRLKKRLAFA
jgi:cytochrome P450